VPRMPSVPNSFRVMIPLEQSPCSSGKTGDMPTLGAGAFGQVGF
jgi:hypothetical protein